MCHTSGYDFFIENVKAREFNGKKVLEVGSRYVNGSVRPLIEKFFSPEQYVGVDIEPGKFVDLVMPAEKLPEYFGPESFDVVIASELLEHVMDWRLVINNMKTVLKKDGHIYITTRSQGFPYHGFPYDFWRYEVEDLARIFKDFETIALAKDHLSPGVFFKARKPEKYTQVDLSNIALYSIVMGQRTNDVPTIEDMRVTKKITIGLVDSKAARWLLPGAIYQALKKL